MAFLSILDFFFGMRMQIVKLFDVGKTGIISRHGDDLIIGLAGIGESESADGSAGDQATGKGRVSRKNHDVHGVAVLFQSLGNNAVFGHKRIDDQGLVTDFGF